MHDIHSDKILILDFGSQYTQLIARRVREAGVYCEIHPSDVDDDDITAFRPNGIILSGGPESVTATDTLTAPDVVFTPAMRRKIGPSQSQLGAELNVCDRAGYPQRRQSGKQSL